MNIQKRLYTCACSPQVSPTVLTTSCSPTTISAIFERIYLCVWRGMCKHTHTHTHSKIAIYTHMYYRFWNIRVNSPADTYAAMPLFHTNCHRIGSVKEDPRTRHWSTLVHYRRLPHFRCGTRSASRRISMMEQLLVPRPKNIFSIVDGESTACNSRTDGRFCSVNRIRRGNSLRSFFNYSAHGQKRRCIVTLGSNVER